MLVISQMNAVDSFESTMKSSYTVAVHSKSCLCILYNDCQRYLITIFFIRNLKPSLVCCFVNAYLILSHLEMIFSVPR